MESRYFVIKHTEPLEDNKLQNALQPVWDVQTYLNPARAVHDFVRMGGLVDKNIIFCQEQPVSIRINNATVEFAEPKEVANETESEDKATES